MAESEVFLRVLNGPRQGLSIPLKPDEPLLIGRSRGDLLLDDPLVSARHCRVLLRNGSVFIHDLHSTNGTMVDGRRVQEHVLRPGANIVVGSIQLTLFAAEATDAGLAEGGIAWLLEEELALGQEAEGGGDVPQLGLGLRLPPGLQLALEVIVGPDQGTRYDLAHGSATIGRRQGEVPLSDAEVSRRHAFIEAFGADMVFVRDNQSTNGTYHNGRRVVSSRLRPGDTVGVGKTVLRLR